MKYDFYIAGPLFSEAELNWNESFFIDLEAAGFTCYLPQTYNGKTLQDFFDNNVKHLLQSKKLIAICDGADMDSGTAWEVGCFYYRKYQTGRGKIYALRTDFRTTGDDGGFNLMISKSADKLFNDKDMLIQHLLDTEVTWANL